MKPQDSRAGPARAPDHGCRLSPGHSHRSGRGRTAPDPPSYSAVRAMLGILEGKGHIRSPAGRPALRLRADRSRARRHAARMLTSRGPHLLQRIDRAGGGRAARFLRRSSSPIRAGSALAPDPAGSHTRKLTMPRSDLLITALAGLRPSIGVGSRSRSPSRRLCSRASPRSPTCCCGGARRRCVTGSGALPWPPCCCCRRRSSSSPTWSVRGVRFPAATGPTSSIRRPADDPVPSAPCRRGGGERPAWFRRRKRTLRRRGSRCVRGASRGEGRPWAATLLARARARASRLGRRGDRGLAPRWWPDACGFAASLVGLVRSLARPGSGWPMKRCDCSESVAR